MHKNRKKVNKQRLAASVIAIVLCLSLVLSLVAGLMIY